MANTPYFVYYEKDKEEFYRGDDKELAQKIAAEKSIGRQVALLGIERWNIKDSFLLELYGSRPVSIYVDRFRGGNPCGCERIILGESQLDFIVEQLLELQK